MSIEKEILPRLLCRSLGCL